MKTDEKRRKQIYLDMTDEEVKNKQFYLYNHYEKVTDYILSKPKDTDNIVLIEPEELENFGVITNGYGIKVWFNYDFKNDYTGGSTNPQIATACNYVFISISKKLNDNKRITETLQHEVIHALDFLAYYSPERRNSESGQTEETPESIGKKYGSNNSPKTPSIIDKNTKDMMESVLYRSDAFEFYALIAGLKSIITEKLRNNPNLSKDVLKKLVTIDSRSTCNHKIQVATQYKDAIKKDKLPKCEDDLKNNLTALIMYCTLLNKDVPAFLFPDYIPEEHATPNSLFSMDEDTFKGIQIKTYDYLSRISCLFNEMVDVIIDDCMKNLYNNTNDEDK